MLNVGASVSHFRPANVSLCSEQLFSLDKRKPRDSSERNRLSFTPVVSGTNTLGNGVYKMNLEQLLLKSSVIGICLRFP